MGKELYKIIADNNEEETLDYFIKREKHIKINKNIEELAKTIKNKFLNNFSTTELQEKGFSITHDALLKSLRKIILLKNKLEEIIKYKDKPIEIYDLLEIYITSFFDEFNRFIRIIKDEFKIENTEYNKAIIEIRNHLIHSYEKRYEYNSPTKKHKNYYFCEIENINGTNLFIIDMYNKNKTKNKETQKLIFNIKYFFYYIEIICGRLILFIKNKNETTSLKNNPK